MTHIEIYSPPECTKCGDRAYKVSKDTGKYYCRTHWYEFVDTEDDPPIPPKGHDEIEGDFWMTMFLTLVVVLVLYNCISLFRYSWVHPDLTQMQVIQNIWDAWTWK